MHRSYEGTNAQVMVYWFDDRIEIINAGAPFGRVTPDNFGKPGFADYRNPTIAETMKILGFVQRFGVGIQMAQNELKANNNPPAEFNFDITTVICTIRETIVSQEVKLRSIGELGGESAMTLKVLKFLQNQPKNKTAIARSFGKNKPSRYLDDLMKKLLKNELVSHTITDKPNSRLQKYKITGNGKLLLSKASKDISEI